MSVGAGFESLRFCLTASSPSVLYAYGKGGAFSASCSSCCVCHLLPCLPAMMDSHPSRIASPNKLYLQETDLVVVSHHSHRMVTNVASIFSCEPSPFLNSARIFRRGHRSPGRRFSREDTLALSCSAYCRLPTCKELILSLNLGSQEAKPSNPSSRSQLKQMVKGRKNGCIQHGRCKNAASQSGLCSGCNVASSLLSLSPDTHEHRECLSKQNGRISHLENESKSKLQILFPTASPAQESDRQAASSFSAGEEASFSTTWGSDSSL